MFKIRNLNVIRALLNFGFSFHGWKTRRRGCNYPSGGTCFGCTCCGMCRNCAQNLSGKVDTYIWLKRPEWMTRREAESLVSQIMETAIPSEIS